MSSWVKKFTKSIGDGPTVVFDTSTLGSWAIRKPTNSVHWNGDTTGRETSYCHQQESFNYILYLIESRTPSMATITGGNMVIHKDDGTEIIQTIGSKEYNEITSKNCHGCYVVKPNSGGLMSDAAILVASTTNAYYEIGVGGASIYVPETGIWFAKRKTTNDYVSGLSW